jgi:hypothetical protein
MGPLFRFVPNIADHHRHVHCICFVVLLSLGCLHLIDAFATCVGKYISNIITGFLFNPNMRLSPELSTLSRATIHACYTTKVTLPFFPPLSSIALVFAAGQNRPRHHHRFRSRFISCLPYPLTHGQPAKLGQSNTDATTDAGLAPIWPCIVIP